MARNRKQYARPRVDANPNTHVCRPKDVGGESQLSRRRTARVRLHKVVRERREETGIAVTHSAKQTYDDKSDVRVSAQDKCTVRRMAREVYKSEKMRVNPTTKLTACHVESTRNVENDKVVERSAGTLNTRIFSKSKNDSLPVSRDDAPSSDCEPRTRKTMVWVKNKGWTCTHDTDDRDKKSNTMIWIKNKGWTCAQKTESPVVHRRTNDSCDQSNTMTWIKDKGLTQTQKTDSPVVQRETMDNSNRSNVMVWVKDKGWCTQQIAQPLKLRNCKPENSDEGLISPLESRATNTNLIDTVDSSRETVFDPSTTAIKSSVPLEQREYDQENHDTGNGEAESCSSEPIDLPQKIVYAPAEDASPKRAIKSLTRLRDLLLVTAGVDYPSIRKSKQDPNKCSVNSVSTYDRSDKTSNPLGSVADRSRSIGLFRMLVT